MPAIDGEDAWWLRWAIRWILKKIVKKRLTFVSVSLISPRSCFLWLSSLWGGVALTAGLAETGAVKEWHVRSCRPPQCKKILHSRKKKLLDLSLMKDEKKELLRGVEKLPDLERIVKLTTLFHCAWHVACLAKPSRFIFNIFYHPDDAYHHNDLAYLKVVSGPQQRPAAAAMDHCVAAVCLQSWAHTGGALSRLLSERDWNRDFTWITACVLHTVEWRYLHIAIVLFETVMETLLPWFSLSAFPWQFFCKIKRHF